MAKKTKTGKKKSRKAAKRAAKRAVKKTARKASAKASKKKTARKRANAPVATLRTPPSSLDMARPASAAQTGRRAQTVNKRLHNKMSAVTGGDVDADVESAYFAGDGAPGGDNPTPDQNDVDDIGQSIGVKYNDNEELRGGEEVVDRDKHRWDNE